VAVGACSVFGAVTGAVIGAAVDVRGSQRLKYKAQVVQPPQRR
jgi:hypothetical protein